MSGRHPAVSPTDAFYARLAPRYDLEFLAPHRRTYDRMAFELVASQFGTARRPLRIVDIGCGTGRWARLLVAAGHSVIGIEPCAEMASATADLSSDLFELQPCRVEDAVVPPGWADLVLAMGSIQYAREPAAEIARCAEWLAPGGVMAVLVDSLGGLVLELLARGDREQALLRATSRRACWHRNDLEVEYHLFDAASLTSAMVAAELEMIALRGLLVSASVISRDARAFDDDDDDGRDRAIERELGSVAPLADSAKQLLAIGRRPGHVHHG